MTRSSKWLWGVLAGVLVIAVALVGIASAGLLQARVSTGPARVDVVSSPVSTSTAPPATDASPPALAFMTGAGCAPAQLTLVRKPKWVPGFSTFGTVSWFGYYVFRDTGPRCRLTLPHRLMIAQVPGHFISVATGVNNRRRGFRVTHGEIFTLVVGAQWPMKGRCHQQVKDIVRVGVPLPGGLLTLVPQARDGLWPWQEWCKNDHVSTSVEFLPHA